VKIVQFGLHYSPNVGDGIITECLRDAVLRLKPGVDFQSIDLSGRTGFGDVMVPNRALALKVLGWLPAAIRGRVVMGRLNAMLDRIEPQWHELLADADLALVGGGQIFSDADLNFCTKISRAAKVLRANNVPTAIYAAGVSQNWSPKGAALFMDLFSTDLRAVGLRDQRSVSAWQDQTGHHSPVPILTRDPGLLAAQCYGPPDRAGDEIGLCITAPSILHYHADRGVAGTGAGGLKFFADLAQALVANGHKLRLFCNGAAEDRAALKQIAAMPAISACIANRTIRCADPPETPAALASILASCAAVVAHRMHACIVAYSYGVPVVGLGWDRKMDSFLASVDRSDWLVGSEQASAPQVADLVGAALAAGVDPVVHARVLAEARQAVATILSCAD